VSGKSSKSDVALSLDDFEVDILEAMIAGELTPECVVGDGAFLKSMSLRERVRPQSALGEIDARVAERTAAEED
jgi:hypothetical protein